jgi:hypothetical protein
MVKNLTVSLEKFYAAYREPLKKMVLRFEAQGISGPVLVSPEQTGYTAQAAKLLLVGSEIRNWGMCSESITDAMKNYEQLSESREHPFGFWQMREAFEKILRIEPGCSAWTSLSKFSFRLSAMDFIYSSEIELFDEMLIGEAVRVRPDVAVFLTSPENDSRIRKIFEGIKIEKVEGFHPNELVQLKHVFLPIRSFRCSHPLDTANGIDRRVLEYIAYPPYQ